MSAMVSIEPIFEDYPVRIHVRDEEPWFVLADVCRVLEIANPSDAAARLDDDEKMTLGNAEGRAGHGAQSFTLINESGLYSLIFRSRKEAAKRFKKWVTAEVLPAIRKTGRYAPAAESQPSLVPLLPEEQDHGYARQEAQLNWYVDQMTLPVTIAVSRANRAKLQALVEVVQAEQPRASVAAICHYAWRNPHVLDDPSVTALRLEHERLRLGLPSL
ncbi:Bro-N domain-containing protein [Caulobacter sp. S45]|uniref:BRO-N domain-containing protein n=1 Tax=Caulobacter sp. S45 TaxID=1641861 RepID=UPI001C2D4FB9|nr:Bro-N domain-containing protein [Caulobacter sp. S45]